MQTIAVILFISGIIMCVCGLFHYIKAINGATHKTFWLRIKTEIISGIFAGCVSGLLLWICDSVSAMTALVIAISTMFFALVIITALFIILFIIFSAVTLLNRRGNDKK